MSENTLGDAPIEPQYHDMMQALAHGIDTILNGDTKGVARETGFVLLLFPFNDKDGRCNYISNGANRDDIVTMFYEQIERFEAHGAKRHPKA